MSQSAVNLQLNPRQADAFSTEATEVLYGGAAGGGKSHLMRIVAIAWCAEIAGLQVYLFRRIKEDLVKNHIEGPKGFRAMLAPWVQSGFVEIVEDEIRFWNGSKIYLCHCKDEKHRFKYLGAEIHVLLIDELTTFSDTIYRFLRGRVRAPGLVVPDKYKDMFPRILCGSNPGNIGHNWVKSAFVANGKDGSIRKVSDSEGGMRRQFIGAKIEDNPFLENDDPGYRTRLRGLGSESLVKAMEDGDWDVIEGAYFDCWSSKMQIRPFEVPEHWTRTVSFDWGSAKPFSVGWWAVATEDYIHYGQTIPKGALIRIREWYGAKSDSDGNTIPDTGLKMTAEAVGDGIRARTTTDINDWIADPAIFAEDGGPSIAERMNLPFRKADNKRVSGRGTLGGWDMMRARMKGEDGSPMLYVFETCHDSIRTIPALQHDDNRPEDLDTDGEDHAADEWRYMCMSRPWASKLPKEDGPLVFAEPTLDELFKAQRPKRPGVI